MQSLGSAVNSIVLKPQKWPQLYFMAIYQFWVSKYDGRIQTFSPWSWYINQRQFWKIQLEKKMGHIFCWCNIRTVPLNWIQLRSWSLKSPVLPTYVHILHVTHLAVPVISVVTRAAQKVKDIQSQALVMWSIQALIWKWCNVSLHVIVLFFVCLLKNIL